MPVIRPQIIETIPNKDFNYYKSKGYIFSRANEKIKIDVSDLPLKSNKKVLCECNKCKIVFKRKMCDIKYLKITFCNKHTYEQTKITNMLVRGCENPMQDENVKEKFKNNYLLNHGCTGPFTDKTVLKKIENILLEKYGVTNILLSAEIRKKIENTNLKKRGCKTPLEDKEILEKTREALKKNRGVDYPLQNADIYKKWEKTMISLYEVDSPLKNKNIKSKMQETKRKNNNGVNIVPSKAQKHIHKLLGGELEKNINGFSVDILLEKKFVIEYDGGGHWLRVIAYKTNTMKEFYANSKIRENVLIHSGYKIIRMINKVGKKDIIPPDEEIENTINNIKDNLINEDKNIARWYLSNNVIIYE
jgi:very-short-patch-repair endonuclease